MSIQKRIRRNQGIIAAAIGSLTFLSCGKSDDSGESPAITASSLADLKLSSSLNLELPDSIAKAGGRSASLALTQSERKRSREACNAVNDIDQMLSSLSMASSMLCHLEAESAQIQFGKKYKIRITEGGQEGDFRVWVDNSQPGRLTMYSCMADQLQQKVVIDGSNGSGSSGSIEVGGSDAGSSFGMALNFDFRDAAVKTMRGQFTFDGEGMSFAQDNDIVLRESGVSVLKVSRKGSFSGDSFAQSTAVKHNGTQGQALMSLEIGGQTFAYRESFDQDGYALADASSVTEDVKLVRADLPAALANGFSIAAPTGWDCSTEETVSVDIDSGSTGPAHAQCDAGMGDSDTPPACAGDDFAYGEEVQE